jgi:hypothetical protein
MPNIFFIHRIHSYLKASRLSRLIRLGEKPVDRWPTLDNYGQKGLVSLRRFKRNIKPMRGTSANSTSSLAFS